MLLLGATPATLWAQSKVPSYAIRSSLHYRESGIPNSRGSEGSAVVTARALLGKDNNTSVELTTGNLDSSATPPGSFAHVLFRPLTHPGRRSSPNLSTVS